MLCLEYRPGQPSLELASPARSGREGGSGLVSGWWSIACRRNAALADCAVSVAPSAGRSPSASTCQASTPAGHLAQGESVIITSADMHLNVLNDSYGRMYL
jgi:hypothetical protein